MCSETSLNNNLVVIYQYRFMNWGETSASVTRTIFIILPPAILSKAFYYLYSQGAITLRVLLKNNYKTQIILLVRQGLKQISFLTNRVQRT